MVQARVTMKQIADMYGTTEYSARMLAQQGQIPCVVYAKQTGGLKGRYHIDPVGYQSELNRRQRGFTSLSDDDIERIAEKAAEKILNRLLAGADGAAEEKLTMDCAE